MAMRTLNFDFLGWLFHVQLSPTLGTTHLICELKVNEPKMKTIFSPNSIDAFYMDIVGRKAHELFGKEEL